MEKKISFGLIFISILSAGWFLLHYFGMNIRNHPANTWVALVGITTYVLSLLFYISFPMVKFRYDDITLLFLAMLGFLYAVVAFFIFIASGFNDGPITT
jgi:hypothetical protein